MGPVDDVCDSSLPEDGVDDVEPVALPVLGLVVLDDVEDVADLPLDDAFERTVVTRQVVDVLLP